MLSDPTRRAIFLDRDGVINRAVVIDGKPYPPTNVATMEILPDAANTLQTLSKAGFLLIVITNQPDVARKITTRETVEEINHYLSSCLPIDEFYVCFHEDQDGCNCRKPLPGLLLTAAKAHNINLQESYMVGDRWRDIDAGKLAGCQTIFIDYGYREPQPTLMNFRVKTLAQVAEIILADLLLTQ